ncbi:unnamed protein product, partial [Closterium sp. Yama58-4]
NPRAQGLSCTTPSAVCVHAVAQRPVCRWLVLVCARGGIGGRLRYTGRERGRAALLCRR